MTKAPPTKIVLAADALVYLPVQILREIEPQCGEESWQQAFEFVRSPSHGAPEYKKFLGDKGCVERILSGAQKGEYVVGVCDPFEIVEAEAESEIVIVGGLIRRPCFWILADKQCALELNPKFFVQHDRNFITGNEVGKLVCEKIGEKYPESRSSLKIVDQTFEDVIDAALALSQKRLQSVAACTASALSAGILHASFPNFEKIVRVDETDPKMIDSSVLTTAFLIHKDALTVNENRLIFETRVKHLLVHTMNQIYQLTKYPKEAERQIELICRDERRFEGEKIVNSLKADSHLNMEKKSKVRRVQTINSIVSSKIRNLLFPNNQDSIYTPLCEVSDKDWSGAYFGSHRGSKKRIRLESIFDRKILKSAQNEFFDNIGRIDQVLADDFDTLSNDRSAFSVISLFLISIVVFCAATHGDRHIYEKVFLFVLCGLFFIRLLSFEKIRLVEQKLINLRWTELIIKALRYLSFWSLIWCIFYIYRVLVIGCEDGCNLSNDAAKFRDFENFQLYHPISYFVTSLGSLLNRINITKDDIYAISAISGTVFLTTTIGVDNFRRELRIRWRRFFESGLGRRIFSGNVK